jgi:hypothetical protein
LKLASFLVRFFPRGGPLVNERKALAMFTENDKRELLSIARGAIDACLQGREFSFHKGKGRVSWVNRMETSVNSGRNSSFHSLNVWPKKSSLGQILTIRIGISIALCAGIPSLSLTTAWGSPIMHTQNHREDDVAARRRYRLCPRCGNFALRSENIAFCMMCGTQLIDVCENCREPILYPALSDCPVCGRGLRKPNGNETKSPKIAVTQCATSAPASDLAQENLSSHGRYVVCSVTLLSLLLPHIDIRFYAYYY